jgi:surface antigen
MLASTAVFAVGLGITPLTGAFAEDATSVAAPAASASDVSIALEPAVPHIPVPRAITRALPAKRTVARAAVTKRVVSSRHHVVRRMAPDLAAGVQSEAKVVLPVKAAPKPTAPAAPSTAPSAGSYPWAHASGDDLDTWGFTERQCVSYAAWRLAKAGHAINNSDNWGDASHWDSTARSLGWSVSTTPHVGDVAQWNAGERSDYYASGSSSPSGVFAAGDYGHVGYVTQVYGDGSVQVQQYNALGDLNYASMRMSAPRFLHP